MRNNLRGALRQNGYRVYASHKGTFFIPQKSLKGLQIHNLVSDRIPKLRKSKVAFSKGNDFQKFWLKFGENQPKFGKNRTKFWTNRPKFRKKSLKGSKKYENFVSQRVDFRFSARQTHSHSLYSVLFVWPTNLFIGENNDWTMLRFVFS